MKAPKILNGAGLGAALLASAFAQESTAKPSKNSDKPNILVIWGDDIGISNISSYSDGIMGYKTPNIDRIANEGIRFTDYYAEQSSTAGRSAFITGQTPVRTGLTKVGMPGAELGIQPEDATIAEMLKPLGYATGQFGKNHLGDRDEFLPTNHGFDIFFGNLYHLNAEEEPEHPDYPTDPEFAKRFGPRGVLKSTSDGKIEDTGPLTKKRMETCDEEFLNATIDFIKEKVDDDQPFFTWFNTTGMHFPTYPRPEIQGQSGQGFYNDAMMEHDKMVGQLLDLLDELGIAENTIVIYSTDNGPHFNMWPDGAITPFKSEKNTNWEGGYRVPAMVRWPEKIKSGQISNEVMSHLDWAPTLLAAAGNPNVKQQLLDGKFEANGKTFRNHLDGYNFLPYLTGKDDKGPRENFFYFNDDGMPVGMRMGDWKMAFAEQRAKGLDVWAEPFTVLRVPHVINLRRDPFERAIEHSDNYQKFRLDRAFLLYKAQDEMAKFLSTFIEYPPSQRPASFSIDQIAEKFLQPKENK
ncbi:arylsulfatase [Aureibacter tunicatorum]|uniref:Arylsulfatase n=1 Tax=Aureibacter tunicatorum TaxID=866807 RepID=A0AAE3XMZ4_9BACT|nr:arylsulfatase [Aureibacter tunicatorum]MDR6238928.1 arylsulfatase [Aureibacter tunicatorum]BDD05145.1 arylsulfatase [Aureibacter tunicatorum]